MMIEGEFVHPFIDTDLDQDIHMKRLVQKMIDEEKLLSEEKSSMNESRVKELDLVGSFNKSSACQQSEYEDLGNQEAMLEALLAKGDEIWQTEIERLADMVDKKRREEEYLREELENVYLSRKTSQESHNVRLQRLTEKERMLIESIDKLRKAKTEHHL